MDSIILPVKPCYVDAIFADKKRWEYRRVAPRRPVARIYLYETAPVSAVSGSVDVQGVVEGTPREVWEATGDEGGISREEFFKYFKGAERAYALRLRRPVAFLDPVPKERFGLTAAPQTFVYLG